MNPWRYFLNPVLLFGAFAALLPLLLHLLQRTRHRTEVWGAMMFLQRSLKVRAKALRLQQWLLLLLRALCFVCLAVALARPVLAPARLQGVPQTGKRNITHPPTTHVIILDASYSMQQGGYETNLFDRVKTSARRILSRLGENDNALLIRAGQSPRPIVGKPSSDLEFLQRKIDGLRAGYERADLVRAAEQALRLLSNSTKTKRRIYILTDRQKISWQDPEDPRWQDFRKYYELQKIRPHIYVFTHQPESPPQNTLIRAIYSANPLIDVYRTNRFLVEIEHFGKARSVRVDFFLDDKPIGEREIELEAGVTVVNFDCSFETPGPHVLSAAIPHDEVAVDNRYRLAVNVVQRVPVLLVEGNSFDDPFAADAALFRAALTAGVEGDDATLIVPTVRNQADIDRLDSAYLARFKVVALVNVRSLSSLFRARLERYVRRGGGLLLALGGDVSIDNYNALYKGQDGLLPTQLTGLSEEQIPPLHPVFPISDTESVLTSFSLRQVQTLYDVRVRRFHQSQPVPGSRILTRVGEFPLLVLKPFGDGNVMLWTTSLNTSWTNLPTTPHFLPLAQDITVFLASTVQPPINLQLGETLLYTADAGQTAARQSKAVVRRPDGTSVPLPLSYVDGQWLGQYTATFAPGLYDVTMPDQPLSRYTVNLDPTEGRLATMDDAGRRQIEKDLKAVFVDDFTVLNRRIEAENRAHELWPLLGSLAIICLMLELYLSTRFSH